MSWIGRSERWAMGSHLQLDHRSARSARFDGPRQPDVVEGALWIVRTGSSWCDLPEARLPTTLEDGFLPFTDFRSVERAKLFTGHPLNHGLTRYEQLKSGGSLAQALQ